MRAFWVLLFLVSVTLTYADIFRLKNGEILEGEKIGEDERSINIKIKYGVIKIDKKEIISPSIKMPEKEQKPIQILKEPVKISKPCPFFTKKEYLQGMYLWLTNQIYPKTGLLESFNPTADIYLEKQASTYDQALAGLAFLVLGDIKKAQAILDFYNRKWKGNGFSNFYFTPTGNPGLEGIEHLGPNMWIALLALHYDRITGKKVYTKLAEDIVRWAMSLPHYRGGCVMSSRDEWRAPWSKVVSTENNIDYYAVLSILKNRIKDDKLRDKIEREKYGVLTFLRKTAYDKKNGGVFRGFHEGKVDKEHALDTVTWLVAAIGIEGLRELRIDIEKLIAFTERKFLVKDEGIKGFDFTDKHGSLKAKRQRMISIEWTFAVVNMYCIYRNYYSRLACEQKEYGNIKKAKALYKKAEIYEHKIVYYLRQMDKKMLKFGPQNNLYTYPYATRSYWLVFYDSPWWKTPKAGTSGIPAGSVASTAWRIFTCKFNPLNYNGSLE